jgi:ABC-type uncharacterized transport system fused permease/ATPase subunit
MDDGGESSSSNLPLMKPTFGGSFAYGLLGQTSRPLSRQVSPRESVMIWDFHRILDCAGVQTRLVELYFENEAEEAEDEAEAQQRPKEQKQKHKIQSGLLHLDGPHVK